MQNSKNTLKIAALVSVTVGREQFRNAEPRFYTAWVMCGRRPHCKEILTFGLRSGASHVSGLFARHHDRWP